MKNPPSLIPAPDLAQASIVAAKWLTTLPDPRLPGIELSKGVSLHSIQPMGLQQSVVSQHPHHHLGPWDSFPKLPDSLNFLNF